MSIWRKGRVRRAPGRQRWGGLQPGRLASAEGAPEGAGRGGLAVHEDARAVEAGGEPEDGRDGDEEQDGGEGEVESARRTEREAGEHEVRREQRHEGEDHDDRRVDRDEARARVGGDQVARDRHEGERRHDLVDLLLPAHERSGARVQAGIDREAEHEQDAECGDGGELDPGNRGGPGRRSPEDQ